MSDNFDEFFDKHAKWTEHDGEPSSESSNSSKYKSSTVSSRKRAKARLEAKNAGVEQKSFYLFCSYSY